MIIMFFIMCFIVMKRCLDKIRQSLYFHGRRFRLLSFLEQHHVFYMWRMREHVYGLDSRHTIVTVKCGKVACLCRRVTAYVHNAARRGAQNGIRYVLMHSCTWRIGYYYVRSAVFGYELVIKNIFHVTCIEYGVVYTVDA